MLSHHEHQAGKQTPSSHCHFSLERECRGASVWIQGPPHILPEVGRSHYEKAFWGRGHSETSKCHQGLFPVPRGRRWSGQNTLHRCHLRFGERGQSRRARRNKGDFLYPLVHSECVSHRAGIPHPGQSHEHVKELEHRKEAAIALLLFYNDALSL